MEQDGKDIKKPVIPKFGSFRPKVAPSPTQSDLLSARDSANAILGSNSQKKTPSAQQHGREHGEEHREEASHDRRRYQRQTPRPRSQGRREQADRSTAISVQDTGVTKPDHSESTNLYSVDLKGDPSNLIYGAIHRYSIPTYNRTGSGSITGLPRYLKIDRDSRHNNALVVFDRASFSLGKREKYVFARNERIAARKLRVRQPNASKTEPECSEDFIALRPWHHVSRKRKLSCESLSSAGEGQETESLGGSAEGKDWRSRKALDADLEYVSESSSSDYETVDMTSIDHASRDHGTKLSRRVEDEPSNVEAWLELIKHQDTLLDQRGQNPNRKSTDAERRSTAEIKIFMYEKALGKLKGTSVDIEPLLLGLMAEGAKVWESQKQVRKWREVLLERPTSLPLWTNFLDFQQTNFVTFVYSNMRVVTIECLNTLRKAVIQAKNSGQETILLEEVLIYIVLRSTLIMRESGFVENATATWQAMLDLHFSEADALKKPKSTALEDIASSIEEFWESEGPRIGEINSAVAQEAALPVMPHLKPGYLEDWARTESIKLSTSTMPAKTVDEVDEEDPYRVVFFSDIKDHLVVCTSESSRMAVLNAFLAFCRLPLLLSDDSDRSRKVFSTDAFIRGSPCGSSDDFVQRIIEPSPARSVLEDAMMPAVEAEQINRIKEAEPFDVPLQNFDCSTFEIFSRCGTWVSAFQSTVQPSSSSHHPWIRQTLRSLLAAGVGGYSLAEYFIGFELAYYPSSVRKTARDLVKKHPSSLRLYNAYALVEWRLDRIEAARKVFATALDMAHTLPENERQDEILLLRTWIWEILQDGGGDEALCKLLSISGGTENDDLGSQISTAAVLRTRRALENGLSLSLRSPNAIHYADVLALLFYLSGSRSLKAALASFARSEEIISPESPCLALLHQARARVLYYHATHLPSATPPASLRAPLAESIRRLPHNTIFLALHGWNEARFRIADRLRATLRDDVLRGSSSSVIGWAFAIWTEIRFGGTAGGNANSVRAVFERALANDSTKSSVLLWTVYVHFSLQRLSPADTAAVFFRGMRACPWAKSFYLLAFSHLGAVLSAAHRRMVWRIMGEKELRVFVDLDETNAGWGD